MEGRCAILVLTRKRQECISIGDDIVVRVLDIKGNAVRIGVEASDATRILRTELKAATRDHAKELSEAADRQRYGDNDE
jgi:carbon storage regulator